jgi:hypothetical protein
MEPVRQLSLFDLESTSSSEGSLDLASRFQLPGARKAPKTSGTSGLISHDSSEKSDPVGYSLRTYLASELSRLTSSSKTWRNSGTPHGRSWWVLTTLAPRTEGRGSSLWPTTAARDWKDDGHCRAAHSRKSPNLPARVFIAGLLDQESRSTNGKRPDWPTPRTTDATGGADPVRADGMRKQGTGPDLKAAIAQEWPTSGSNRFGAPDSHGKSPIRGSLNPRWVAQLMGFPVDWLDSPPPIAAKPLRLSGTRSSRKSQK